MRVAIGVAFILAVVLGLAVPPSFAAGPSFDCAKAGNWVEKAICKSDELAALDAWFAPLYGQVLQRLKGKEADDLKARRKAWLKQRNDCKAEADGAACLKDSYQTFIAELEGRFVTLAGGATQSLGVKPTPKSSLAECAGQAELQACLNQLVDAADADLATIEASVRDAAVSRDQATQTTHVADRAAEANVAWRAYRNAECKRRQEISASEADATAAYSACLVELTRARVRELQS